MPIRAVFFDFGGTLVASVPDVFEPFSRVFDRFGWTVTPASYAAANARVLPRMEKFHYSSLGEVPSFWDRVHREVLGELGIPDDDRAITRALREAATSPAIHVPFPETESVLAALRTGGYSVHMVSNNTDYLLETISRLRWEGRFETVTFSQEAGAEKPDSAVFDLAVGRAGCSAQEALHVGDSYEADYLGAVRAGLRALWLNRGRAEPPAPCDVVYQLSDIIPWIQRANRG